MITQLLLMMVAAVGVRAASESYQPRYFKALPRPLHVKYVTANAEEGSKKRTGDKSTPFAIEDLMDASIFNKSLAGTIFLLSGGAYKLGAKLVCVGSCFFFL
jgi:hypothetical protein